MQDAEVPAGISTHLRSFNVPAQWAGTLEMELNAFDSEVGTDLGVIEFVLKSANYDDVTIPVRVKVKAKTQETLRVELESWTYGEPANPPAYTVPDGATQTTLTYTSRDGQTSCGSTPPTDAGDYTLTVRCEGIDTVWTGSADFTVAEQPVVTYPVSLPDGIENGSVSANVKCAAKGRTVTITVTPHDGFELAALTVTDKNGNALELTGKGDGKYSFVMPAGKVEVRASFTEPAEVSPFDDVPTDSGFYEAVKWAAENGITGGIGGGLFSPGNACTRAQVVTFLWRLRTGA